MKNKKFTILYVDDDEVNLKVFVATFAREFKILTALDPEEGLEILNEESVDLIISDQRMHKMTGIEFLEQAMNIKPESPRILLTGYVDMSVISSAVNKVGIYKYLTKPWKEPEMRTIIYTALELYQVKQEKQRLFHDLEKALELVRAQEERLQMAIHAANQGTWDWKINTDILYISPECYEILGYKPYEFEANIVFWSKLINEEDLKDALQFLDQYLEGGIDILEKEIRIKDKSNNWRWINIMGKIVEENNKGKPERLTGIIMDVTDKKKAQDQIIATIVQTEDKERRRVAKELHDSLGQSLTTSVLNFNYVKKGIVKMDEPFQLKFQTGLDFLNQSIKEARNISHNLLPQTIMEYGYVTAVESMLVGLKGVTKTKFQFHQNMGEKRLSLPLEVGMYRITQEAVNNILKYAKADSATIQLMCYKDEVYLTIEDNGVGFQLEKLEKNDGSLGISSMESRVKALHGRINIKSKSGKGTSICAQLPVES